MAINNQSSVAAFLKYHYAKKVGDTTMQDNPFLARVKKVYNWGGGQARVPVKIALGSGGGSHTIADAIANTSSILGRSWYVDTCKYYHVAAVDGETFSASKHAPDVFLDVSKEALNSALQDAANVISHELYRDGIGIRGRIDSNQTISSTTTVTLSNADDAKNFEIGMSIVAGSGSAGTDIKAVNGVENACTISGIDRRAGTLTFSTTVDSFAANDWAAGDALYKEGDQALAIKGLAAHLPTTIATSGDSFFSIDRAVDAQRLGGIVINATGKPLVEALIDAAVVAGDYGARPSVCYMSFANFGNLCKELQGQAIQSSFKVGEVSFSGIKVNGPKGMIECIPDRNCQETDMWLLDEGTWTIYSRTSKVISIDDRDGLIARLSASADQLDYRLYAYIQLVCDAPGKNVRIRI